MLLCRIIRVLRDLDGNSWRDKLPKNPDSERVLAALSNQASFAVPSTPTQSETATPDVHSSPPNDVTIKESTATTESVSIEQQFEETKRKGNTFVKKVSIIFVTFSTNYVHYLFVGQIFRSCTVL